MRYALIDAANARGQAPHRDIGRLLSRHHTIQAAERAAERLQRGQAAYLPLLVVELATDGIEPGHMVTAGDCVEQDGGTLEVRHG